MKNFLLVILLTLLSFNVFSAWPWETDTVRQEMDVLKLRKMGTDPSTADNDSVNLFLNADKKVVYKDDAGDVKNLGGGVGGTLSTVWTQDFEEVKLIDFFYGNHANVMDIAKTALVGALSFETTTPLAGKQSIKYVQDASDSVNDFFCTPEQDVELAFRKNNINKISFPFTYNGDRSDIKFSLYDVTNSQVVAEAQDLPEGEDVVYRFANSSSTEKVRLCFQVKVHNASKILVVDNVQHDSNGFDVGQMLRRNSVSLSGNDNRAIATATEDVFFAGSGTGWSSVGDVNRYAVQYSDSKITMSGSVIFNSAANRDLALYKNGVFYRPILSLTDDDYQTFTYTSHVGEFEVRDSLSIRVLTNSGTLVNTAGRHYLNIVEEAYADNVIVDAAVSGLNTTNAGTLTISATTTAPTKGTVVTDKVWVVNNMNDTATIRFEFEQSSAGTAGSGDYLFKMPAGMEIDLTKVTPYTNIEGSGTYRVPTKVGDFAFGESAGSSGTGDIVVYDKDYVRATSILSSSQGYIGSAFASLSNSGQSYSATFTVPIKGRSVDSLPISLDVSSERENGYTAIVNTSGAIETQSPVFLTSASGTTGTGRRTLVWPDGFFGTEANKISVDVQILDVDGTLSGSSVSNITTTGARVFTWLGAAASFQRFKVTVRRMATDYRPPKAYVAGQVALTQVAYLKDVKPSGTAGGTFTSGAWQTRTLNTVEGDSIVSLESNQFTILRKGKYLIEAIAPAIGTNIHKARLYNISDSIEYVGSDSYSGSSAVSGTSSSVFAQVIISSAKTFELQHRAGTTRASDGFGLASTFGNNEVYAQVKITKLQ